MGDAGIMVPPTDREGLISAMKKLYSNEALREELSRRGVERAKNFSWEKAVRIVSEKIKSDFADRSEEGKKAEEPRK